MKYQVIARKFRPQVFENVVGQAPIVQTLQNAISMGRMGHAYLFSGPRGVGKTTMARLLAKALNCSGGPTPTPCNECPSCTEIAGGRSIDVLEIDAASNTGVDSIRELRENARYSPSRDRFKIFIVDEVHMLSTSAFNALLKTLEEPPEHVVFIMATTERHKLPATILSRCQQFIFRTIPPGEILAHLKSIAEREGIAVGEGTLDYVVKAAGGSMRDAQSVLEQIIAFGGQQVSDDEVRNVLGFMPTDLLGEAVDAIAERDATRLLRVVGVVSDQGLHIGQFVRELLGEIRNLLLVKFELPDKVTGSPEDRARTEAQAHRFSEQDLIRFFDILLQVESDLRWTSEPRFHLEVGCVKLTRVGQLRNLEDVIRDLKNREPASESGDTIAPRASAPTSQPAGPNPLPVSSSLTSEPGGPEMPPAPSASPRNVARDRSGRSEDVGSRETPAETRPTKTSHARETRGAALAAAAKEPTVSPGPAGSSDREAARAEPVVQSFLDVFRGEIAHVKSTKTQNEPEED